MTNLDIIRELKGATFIDEDDSEYQLEFQAGLKAEELKSLQEKFPSKKIDAELLKILGETRGWEGYGPSPIEFDSIGEFGFLELAPWSITLGHDGLGNFWILDIDAKGNLGKVYFACHDPAVLIVHSQNLNEYLLHLLSFYKEPHESHVSQVSEVSVMNIWTQNPNILPKQEFEYRNPEFTEFLSEYDGANWNIADLRKGDNKDGFAWGIQGPNQLKSRHLRELIWVLQIKEKGFFARLFGAKS